MIEIQSITLIFALIHIYKFELKIWVYKSILPLAILAWDLSSFPVFPFLQVLDFLVQ